MWLFSWFVSHGYTPFRGPLLVASSNRDLASSASLLVLGPPVIGVRWLLLLVVIAPFRVFCLALVRYLLGIVWWGWVHPWWAAGVLLFWFTSGFTRVGVRWLVLLVVMPLLECSAWHSSDTCLVLYHGVGSTRVGRRACCCFRCCFRAAVRAAFRDLGQLKFYFKRHHLPAVFVAVFRDLAN